MAMGLRRGKTSSVRCVRRGDGWITSSCGRRTDGSGRSWRAVSFSTSQSAAPTAPRCGPPTTTACSPFSSLRPYNGLRDPLLSAAAFRLHDLGEGLTEAEIVKVLVHEGEDVREDAPLLEVETDKAQVEIPSPMSGRVEKIHVQAGQTVKVGQVLVSFGGASATPGTK